MIKCVVKYAEWAAMRVFLYEHGGILYESQREIVDNKLLAPKRFRVLLSAYNPEILYLYFSDEVDQKILLEFVLRFT